MPQNPLIGKKCRIKEPIKTRPKYGVVKEMKELINREFTITKDHYILFNGAGIEGIEVFGYNWAIEDIEFLEEKKSIPADKKNIFFEEKMLYMGVEKCK